MRAPQERGNGGGTKRGSFKISDHLVSFVPHHTSKLGAYRRASLFLDGIAQTTYIGGVTTSHGSFQGNQTTFAFSNGELITSLSGLAGNLINSIVLQTSLGKTYSVGASSSGVSTFFNISGPIYGLFGENANFGGGYTLTALGIWTDASFVPPSPPPPP